MILKDVRLNLYKKSEINLYVNFFSVKYKWVFYVHSLYNEFVI